jgi:hypothetical protein
MGPSRLDAKFGERFRMRGNDVFAPADRAFPEFAVNNSAGERAEL